MALLVVEIYWIRMLFKELRVPLLYTPCLWVDNIGALSLSPPILYFMPGPNTLKWITTSSEKKFSTRISMLGTSQLIISLQISSPKVCLQFGFFSYETS
jgi:hypothetical protein